MQAGSWGCLRTFRRVAPTAGDDYARARMPEIALEPRPGDSVGPYKITRVIGRGRMGIVFEAAADGEEPVAVKVVTTELTQDEVFLRRFRREVAAAQKIDHANVVPVLAHGDEGGLPYLVQRLIPGGSLADRIAAEGTLGLQTTLKLLAGAAAGIDALHAGGLVHRDIKPANILLDGDTAYVSDFGLAKDSQASNLTRPGQALGSLDYMAPEQIRGEDVSPATDIYALGCVFVECLTGKPPFGGRPSMRVLFAHLQDPPPDLTEVRRDLSPDVARAVARAMEKEAVDRPTSAAGYVASVARASGS
jgi:serine/threonine-protein kinase